MRKSLLLLTLSSALCSPAFATLSQVEELMLQGHSLKAARASIQHMELCASQQRYAAAQHQPVWENLRQLYQKMGELLLEKVQPQDNDLLRVKRDIQVAEKTLVDAKVDADMQIHSPGEVRWHESQEDPTYGQIWAAAAPEQLKQSVNDTLRPFNEQRNLLQSIKGYREDEAFKGLGKSTVVGPLLKQLDQVWPQLTKVFKLESGPGMDVQGISALSEQLRRDQIIDDWHVLSFDEATHLFKRHAQEASAIRPEVWGSPAHYVAFVVFRRFASVVRMAQDNPDWHRLLRDLWLQAREGLIQSAPGDEFVGRMVAFNFDLIREVVQLNELGLPGEVWNTIMTSAQRDHADRFLQDFKKQERRIVRRKMETGDNWPEGILEDFGTPEVAGPLLSQFDQAWAHLTPALGVGQGPGMDVEPLKAFLRPIPTLWGFEGVRIPSDAHIDNLFAYQRAHYPTYRQEVAPAVEKGRPAFYAAFLAWRKYAALFEQGRDKPEWVPILRETLQQGLGLLGGSTEISGNELVGRVLMFQKIMIDAIREQLQIDEGMASALQSALQRDVYTARNVYTALEARPRELIAPAEEYRREFLRLRRLADLSAAQHRYVPAENAAPLQWEEGRAAEKLGAPEIAGPLLAQFEQAWPGLKKAFDLGDGPAMNVAQIKKFFAEVRPSLWGDRLPSDQEVDAVFAYQSEHHGDNRLDIAPQSGGRPASYAALLAIRKCAAIFDGIKRQVFNDDYSVKDSFGSLMTEVGGYLKRTQQTGNEFVSGALTINNGIIEFLQQIREGRQPYHHDVSARIVLSDSLRDEMYRIVGDTGSRNQELREQLQQRVQDGLISQALFINDNGVFEGLGKPEVAGPLFKTFEGQIWPQLVKELNLQVPEMTPATLNAFLREVRETPGFEKAAYLLSPSEVQQLFEARDPDSQRQRPEIGGRRASDTALLAMGRYATLFKMAVSYKLTEFTNHLDTLLRQGTQLLRTQIGRPANEFVGRMLSFNGSIVEFLSLFSESRGESDQFDLPPGGPRWSSLPKQVVEPIEALISKLVSSVRSLPITGGDAVIASQIGRPETSAPFLDYFESQAWPKLFQAFELGALQPMDTVGIKKFFAKVRGHSDFQSSRLPSDAEVDGVFAYQSKYHGAPRSDIAPKAGGRPAYYGIYLLMQKWDAVFNKFSAQKELTEVLEEFSQSMFVRSQQATADLIVGRILHSYVNMIIFFRQI